MRVRCDPNKRDQVLGERGIDLQKLEELFELPYIEDVRNDNPLQFRVIGFAGGILTTYVVEYRRDEIGEYAWVVTAWRSTSHEEEAYEQATQGYGNG